MNVAATTTVRDDGYVQDLGSQLVAELVAAEPDDVVVDLCSAPGGKATAMASCGALGRRRRPAAPAGRSRPSQHRASGAGHGARDRRGRRPPTGPARCRGPCPARCAVFGAGRAPTTSRCPVATRSRGGRAPRCAAALVDRCRGPAAAARRRAGLQRVHAERCGDHRGGRPRRGGASGARGAGATRGRRGSHGGGAPSCCPRPSAPTACSSPATAHPGRGDPALQCACRADPVQRVRNGGYDRPAALPCRIGQELT